MKLGDVIVQGGLLSRDVDHYNDWQAERDLRMRTIQSGIRRLDDEDAMRPARLELERLKQDITRTELEYKKRAMPDEQSMADAERGMRRSDLQHRATLQPGQQELATTQQQTALTTAKAAGAMAPGAARLAQEQQNEQLRTLREQQMARMWTLYRAGDQAGFLDVLNNSAIVAPGRKFSEVKQVQMPGTTGQQVPALQFVPADGGQPVTVPIVELQQLEQKYGSKIEKVGNNLVRIGPGGQVTPLYEQDQFIALPEGSTMASRRTGQTVGGGGGGERLGRRWQEGFEKDALPMREATEPNGSKKIDPKTGAAVMEVDDTLAPIVRDMVRMNSDVLAKGKIAPGEAGAVFGQFARASKEKDPAKGFKDLDQAGRLVVVTDKAGTPVRLLGRLGTAQDGSPIVFELPTGLEKLLLDQELENRFQREQGAAAVDEGPRLRRTHPNNGSRSASGRVRYPEASGVNP